MNNGNNNFNRRKTDENINRYDNYDVNMDDDTDNNQNRRNSEQTNDITNRMNRVQNNDTTMIGMSSNTPLDIDYNSFMENVMCDQTVNNISKSNDLPIISEVKFLFKKRLMNSTNLLKDYLINGWGA